MGSEPETRIYVFNIEPTRSVTEWEGWTAKYLVQYSRDWAQRDPCAMTGVKYFPDSAGRSSVKNYINITSMARWQ